MFNRTIISELVKWAEKPRRKPLVLRGARQVGKTTVANLFSKNFDQYIYLNLELAEDRKVFEDFQNVETLLDAIFFLKDKSRSEGRTLLFIDEIQEAPQAIEQLRYFYEQVPELWVMAAGSLLETLFNKDINFPVGRVTYMVVRPVSFVEFLEALGETNALEQWKNVPIADFAHDKLLELFHRYALIGGMPEVVDTYAATKDIVGLQPVYESLLVSYLEDVEKYARNQSLAEVMRHAIRSSFAEAGQRIKFQGFGRSNYGSREMGEAIRTLERAMLVNLVYPATQVTLPILEDRKKSPRLQVLDTGLLNHFAGLQKEVLGTKDLNSIYQGGITGHIVGQELLASSFNVLGGLHFWVREKRTSSAEIDFLYLYNNLLIPLEVKSGATGKLKSLHIFMDRAPHTIAIRLYSGKFQIDKLTTVNGKAFFLLNLPYYLVAQIDSYLNWFLTAYPDRID
ncbi:MAG: AAA family ATPase [Cytophagales bacterium]|nr:AAA family ATPase [Cytophagales bacterium]